MEEDDETDDDERAPHIPRKRKSVDKIFEDLGPALTRRAYRMTASLFWALLAGGALRPKAFHAASVAAFSAWGGRIIMVGFAEI